jgi:TPR repeat protein
MGRLFEDMGNPEKAAQLYEHGLAHPLPQESYWDTVQRLSFIHKRRGDLPAAVALWRQAAGSGQVYAHVELAKYYEHQVRDYHEAVSWTQTCIALVKSPGFPRQAGHRWLADLEHRLTRLQAKR